MAKAENLEHLAQHVEAGARVRAVEHDGDGAVRAQHRAEGAQAGDRVGHVVQHAGDIDEVEGLAERRDVLDAALVQGQVGEGVAVLKRPLVGEAGGAEIKADDARRRVMKRVARGSVGAAAGDQHIEIVARRLVGPEGVPVAREIAAGDTATLLGRAEVGDGLRVDPTLVLGGDRVIHCRCGSRMPAHSA